MMYRLNLIKQTQSKNQIRKYSTEKKSIFVQSKNNENSLILPLTQEKCIFPLYNRDTVRDLVHDIRSEDGNINKIEFSDLNGIRLSHSVPIKDLLTMDFQLTLNTELYQIHVPQAKTPVDFVGDTNLKDLIKKVYFLKIKEKLEGDSRKNIPVSEYMGWCKEYGITESEAENLLKSLHHIGAVLHFRNNRQLADTIFLRPAALTEHLSDSLKLRVIKSSDISKQETLDSLLPEFEALSKQKTKYENAANRRAEVMLWTGLVYLTSQFGLMFRWCYNEFSWDVVEPISYFVTLGTIIVGYVYFLVTDHEYSYEGLRDHIKDRRLKSIYLKKNFNWKRWSELNQQITTLKKSLDIRN